jgi:hypothetical protein
MMLVQTSLWWVLAYHKLDSQADSSMSQDLREGFDFECSRVQAGDGGADISLVGAGVSET